MDRSLLRSVVWCLCGQDGVHLAGSWCSSLDTAAAFNSASSPIALPFIVQAQPPLVASSHRTPGTSRPAITLSLCSSQMRAADVLSPATRTTR